MGKIGSTIRERRQSKGWSLDRAADDTNISVRFLSKIENDDFTGFPGEPYIVGFIRNYAEYLGLDGEALIARYREKGEPSAQVTVQEVPADAAAAPDSPAAAVPPADIPQARPSGRGRKAARTKAAGAEPASMDPEQIKAFYTASPPGHAAAHQAAPLPHEAFLPGVVEEVPAAQVPTKGRQKRSRQAAPAEASEHKEPAQTGRATGVPSGQDTKASGPALPASPPPAKVPAMRINPLMAGGMALILAFLAIMSVLTFSRKSAETDRKDPAKQATEYSVEGSPFEQRLHTGDSLLVPLRENVYKISLAAIGETVRLESPFGPYELSLGATASIDPDQDGIPDVIILLGDFDKEKAQAGALLKVEFPITSASGAQPDEVTIPAGAPPAKAEGSIPAAAPASAALAPAPAAETVILRSSRGPYPFVAQISFRGSCLFRYEADRKEWVEKFYAKGESITVNVSSSLTLWASNAQAAKLGIQVSGGKTADLEIGGPGEIAVKRISWSRAEGTWALAATELD